MVKGEAVAAVGELVVGLHGVLEAAGLPDDGHGAVAHGDELGQAAGLEEGGHQQGVGAGVDPVGQGFVIGDIGADAALVVVLKPAEALLVAGVAGAQDHHLGVAVQQGGKDGIHQIQALLIGQPGDQAQHHLIGVLLQAQLLLEGQLVGLLQLQEVVRAVGGGQQLVAAAVPLLHVDAVDDAPELARVIAQMCVQALAEEGGLDLPGVGAADGGDHVAVGQAALEHVGVHPVLGQGVLVEHVVGQIGPVLDGGDIVDALKAEVVDGDDGLRAAQGRGGEKGPQEDRHQARLPVVAVDNVGDPVHIVQGGQGGLAEVAEPGDVVH